MEAVDTQTIRFTLSAPLSSFADVVTFVGIAPEHAMAPDPKAFAIKPIGTGPFILSEFVPNDRIVLTANPKYWAGAPSIDKLIFLYMPDAATRLAALEAGTVDIATPLLGTQIDELKSHKGLTVQGADSTQRVDLWVNNTVAPFNNKFVREALSYAIDRKAMVDTLAPGSTPAIGPITRSSWGFDPNLKGYTYDPQKAKSLLAQGGYPDGVDFTLLISTRAGEDREAALVQQQAAAAGIRVKVSTMDYAALIQTVITKRAFQVARLTATQTPDPDSMTYIYFYSTSAGNYYGYKNPQIDTLLDQGRSTVDQAARTKIYSQIQTILLDDAPNVWMYYNKFLFGVGPRVRNFKPIVTGFIVIKTNYGADVSVTH
jgi:peptide/nickel transport system substrate-binding protein